MELRRRSSAAAAAAAACGGGSRWSRGATIGKGSFGTVSLAHDLSTGARFAVKSVDLDSCPAACAVSLENEIEILRSISSPYIVSYLGDDTTDGSVRNLHIEYMDGGTAADVGPMDELEVREYAKCVVGALHYLHSEAGIVHGDVKGRNVLLGSSPGEAKLADFGCATRAFGSGGARGTPLWMAPEVARGGGVTPASDVWSLGCTVLEMLTGAPPWSGGGGGGGGDLMVRIGYGEETPVVPGWVSKDGRDFLGRCLRREAAERWSCGEMVKHPFLAGGRTGEVGPSPRCVLHWGVLDFGYDDDGEEEEVEGDSGEVVYLARERLRGLVTDEMVGGWESGGWEVVRWGGGGEEAASVAGRTEDLGGGAAGDAAATVTNRSDCSSYCRSVQENRGIAGVNFLFGY